MKSRDSFAFVPTWLVGAVLLIFAMLMALWIFAAPPGSKRNVLVLVGFIYMTWLLGTVVIGRWRKYELLALHKQVMRFMDNMPAKFCVYEDGTITILCTRPWSRYVPQIYEVKVAHPPGDNGLSRFEDFIFKPQAFLCAEHRDTSVRGKEDLPPDREMKWGDLITYWRLGYEKTYANEESLRRLLMHLRRAKLTLIPGTD